MTESWDIAVVGDHLGGVAAAALAARRGRRVLLLETQEGGTVRPLEYLNGLAAPPELEPGLGRVFQEVGRSPYGPLGDDRIHFRALDPPLQVCLERHRVAFHPERTARTFELQREFGDAHRLLAPLWQREAALRERAERAAPREASASLAGGALAGVSGYVRVAALEREAARPALSELLAGAGLPEDLAAALVVAVQAVTRRPGAGLSWGEGMRALRVAQGGVFQNAAGQGGVIAGLRSAFETAGGEARPLVALEGMEGARTGGVRLHLAAGGTVRADRVVVDLDVDAALALLPAAERESLERKGVAEREDREYGLLEGVLGPGRRPEGMGDFLAIAPPGAEAEGSALLLAMQPGWSLDPEGPCRFEALALFPPGAADAGGAGWMMERLRTVMPFLDESLLESPVFRSGPAPLWSRERLGRAQREERVAAGHPTTVFRQGPYTFLRNADYATVGLAEALSSALVALA